MNDQTTWQVLDTLSVQPNQPNHFLLLPKAQFIFPLHFLTRILDNKVELWS